MVQILSVKPTYLFTIIGCIHILIGLSLLGMIPNFDTAISNWLKSEISFEAKRLIIGQIKVVTSHSIGIGTLMLVCRGLKSRKDIKTTLGAYIFFASISLLNEFYEIFFGTNNPPLPVILLLIVAWILGVYGFMINRQLD